jgi:hypothetical protein
MASNDLVHPLFRNAPTPKEVVAVFEFCEIRISVAVGTVAFYARRPF